jgi:hypothetical protein
MGRCKNEYTDCIIDGEEVVIMMPNNQKDNLIEVIVPKDAWVEYLCEGSWSIQWERLNESKIKNIQARIGGTIKPIHRAIFEYYYDEEKYYNKQIDHKNNNPLDNRITNLRAVPSNINGINKEIKIREVEKGVFQILVTIGEKTFNKKFYNIESAKQFEKEVIKYREREIDRLLKYDRHVEFKRGLELMIDNNEVEIIKKILKEKNIL